MNILRILGLFLITNFGMITSTMGSSSTSNLMDTIVNRLTSLTCETDGVGDLLHSEFSHTCIPAPFSNLLVANIVSPGLYANMMLRLKLNDEELFPNGCKRRNRVNFHDPKISFAMCSNVKLLTARTGAVAESIIAIAKAAITGIDPWGDIQNAWALKKSQYHEVDAFKDKREGDQGDWVDLGVIPIFPWKIITEKDKMCVATAAFTGWIPVGCKYFSEPYPESIYASFMDLRESSSSVSDPTNLTKCSNIQGCYQRAYSNSKTGIVITAPLIECIREMTARLLISRDVCSLEDINSIVNSAKRESSSLFQFQKNMHKIVAALLILYVIIYGFKIVLSGDVPPKADIINFILKIIFVTYFSVGININQYTTSDYGKLDGMVQWVLPFMLNGINQLASWIINSSPSTLCKFNPADYPSDLSYMTLWDSLDCKIAHYLGLDILSTMLTDSQMQNKDFTNFDFFNYPIPPYYYLLIPAAISGQMILVNIALMYPLLVISVAAYLINTTIVSMLLIVILGVLAPLFVPMVLFEQTKGYFESWVKLLLSFMLQPMVVTTFMIIMFSIYDVGFYGACKYLSHEITSDTRKTKIFRVDNNFAEGNYSAADAASCKNSLGYMLNNPIDTLNDYTKSTIGASVVADPDKKDSEYMKIYNFLDSVSSSDGMFFTAPTILFEKIKDIILALITACFALYLMYYLSSQLSEFAADMTEGVSLSSVAIKPQAIFKAGQGVINAIRTKGGTPVGKGERAGATDKLSTGSNNKAGATDRLSTGSNNKAGATDRLSTGSNNKAEDTISKDVPKSEPKKFTVTPEMLQEGRAELRHVKPEVKPEQPKEEGYVYKPVPPLKQTSKSDDVVKAKLATDITPATPSADKSLKAASTGKPSGITPETISAARAGLRHVESAVKQPQAKEDPTYKPVKERVADIEKRVAEEAQSKQNVPSPKETKDLTPEKEKTQPAEPKKTEGNKDHE